MLERLATSLHIDLCAQRLTLLERPRWSTRPERILADQRWPEGDPGAANLTVARLREVLGSTDIRGRSARIILADDLVRYFMVRPPGNAARMGDCKASAAMRFQSLYGESSADWLLAAEWDARHPFVACAIPHSLRDDIVSIASEHALRVLQIEPCFIAAWNRWHGRVAANAWFGVATDSSLTIGMIDEQRLCAVRSASLRANVLESAGCLHMHLEREALMHGLPLPQKIQLCGNAPDHWLGEAAGPVICEWLDAPLQTGTGE